MAVQRNNVISITLVKSINVYFLNQICYFSIKQLPNVTFFFVVDSLPMWHRGRAICSSPLFNIWWGRNFNKFLSRITIRRDGGADKIDSFYFKNYFFLNLLLCPWGRSLYRPTFCSKYIWVSSLYNAVVKVHVLLVGILTLNRNVKPGWHVVLFDKSRLFPAPGFSFILHSSLSILYYTHSTLIKNILTRRLLSVDIAGVCR